MRRALSVGVAWLALAGSAEARPPPCWDRGDGPVAMTCRHTFIATAEPKTFRVARHFGKKTIARRWESETRRQFLTGSGACRTFGRWGTLRVREKECGDLVITFRSTNGPQRITYVWERLR